MSVTVKDRKFILSFLKDLEQNNSKEWMDAHRNRYQDARTLWIAQVEEILARLGKDDGFFKTVDPKKTLSRINNNRRFHPDKPIYKNFFTCDTSAKQLDGALYFICIQPGGSFLGGGFWKPEKEKVEQIRDAIDYNGEKLQGILETASFQKFYEGMGDDPDKLKTSPQGYPSDHPHIDLINHKNFVATHSFSDQTFFSDQFLDLVEESYHTIKPFSEYLLKALTVEV